jgi:hypothetical protein
LVLNCSSINLNFKLVIYLFSLKKIVFVVLLSGLLNTFCFSQTGGKTSFQFVNLPGNAHVAGIGGMNVSVYDRDINMVWQNPALLRDTMNRFLSVNYIPFFASVKGGSMSYSHKFKGIGTIAAGIQYINYGSMTERDETGNELGTFKPQDLAVMVAKSHTIGIFTLGGTLKYVASSITPAYTSYGLMMDAGGIFRHPVRDFTIGLVFKNIGFAVKKYNKEAPARAPFDIQLGTSYKLEHIPVRLSLTAHHLYKFDLAYLDTTQNKKYDLDGNEIKRKKSIADKVLPHFIIGTEFLLSKNLHARLAYNFQRRREMRLEDKAGGTGFSWGIMFRIKWFEFDFSRATYSLAGGKNWVTVTMDMDRLFGKN